MVQIALLGFGVVGSGVAEVITRNQTLIEEKIGEKVSIKYILDLRDFPDSPFGSLVVHDFNIIRDDPDVCVVAEMMGGSHPAYEFTKACLEAGKSVVTSNKELVAMYGPELLTIAWEHQVAYLFEASVGGGIPLLRPMTSDLSSNHVTAVSGILNGTTNYILTQMRDHGADFATALKEAQSKGYAEADPSADIDGPDAARKIVILAATAFGKRILPSRIPCEGITSITKEDTELAESIGYAIKLIGHTSLSDDGRIYAMVSPRLVPLSSPLYGVNDVFNGILVRADMVGEVMFYGPGAGKLPTASAVVSDILDILSHKADASVRMPAWEEAEETDIADFSGYVCRNLVILDAPAEAEQELSRVFGEWESPRTENGRFSFITGPISEAELSSKISSVPYPLVNRIRVL